MKVHFPFNKIAKVRPLRYFELFGEKWAVHKEIWYSDVDDDFYPGDWYVVSHYKTGMMVAKGSEPYNNRIYGGIKEAIRESKKLLNEIGEEKVLKAIGECKIINK